MAAGVEGVLATAGKAVSNDLVVLQGRWYRKVRSKEPTGKLTKKGRTQYRTVERLEPIDSEFHLNPVGLGLGAAGLGIGGMFAFGELKLPHPFGGEVVLYRGFLRDWLEARREREEGDGESNLEECLRACREAYGDGWLGIPRRLCEDACRKNWAP